DNGFRVWDSNSGWFNVGGFAGYNQWYRIGFILSGGQELFYVNGTLVGTVADSTTTQFSNVILQGYNSGQSYNIAWDNLTASPDGLDLLRAQATAPVPEPLTLAMWSAAVTGLGLAAIRRRRAAR